jgi:predicted nuclease of restriction endonuclease-like (RecB) superfamily
MVIMKKTISKPTVVSKTLVDDIRLLINTTRRQVAQVVNSSLVVLYWNIGRRIKVEVLKEKRAAYGQEIVVTLSQQLVAEFGEGFSRHNLSRMVKFYEYFPDEKIVATLSQELSWSHIIAILPVTNPLGREFYAEMSRMERWSVRTLRQKIDGMLFERTALSKKPEHLIKQELEVLRKEDKISTDLVFRDPYFLDFLGLTHSYSEKDLETAILREMEAFLLELGVGFTFVARQKRITIDHEDYYIDLLLYHRKLQRLVAIELKLGRFKYTDKGQMELYLRWLEKYEKQPGEEAPLGLILCAGKSDEHIELLQLSKSGIRVAEYLTEMLPKKVLEQKLHNAIRMARGQIENRSS